MNGRLTMLGTAALVLVTTAVSACGGGTAAAPTAAPTVAAPKVAATTPPAPTVAAPTVAPTVAAPTVAAPTVAAPTAAATSGAAATGDVAAGKTVYDQYCNSCHPNGQKGAGPAIAGGTLPASRIQSQVRNGGGGMPAFPATQISDQQMTNLVAYVLSLK